MEAGRTIWLCLATVAAGLLTGCASRGSGPQGGPVDSIPPRVLSSVPEDGATHVRSQEIQIRFNEYVKLDRATEQVLISPPGQSQPVIKAVGKKVSVTLSDSLAPNTTYTIYFGQAIQDNNEKNALQDYTLSFTTGDRLDSLTLSGDVLFARTLKPAHGAIVGIHPADAEDSTVCKKPFLRIARADSAGHFVIRHIAEGTYRVYALSDSNRTYTYEPNEPIAFSSRPVTVPDSGLTLRLFNCILPRDTMKKALPQDSLETDSIVTDSLRRDSLVTDSLKTDSVKVAEKKKEPEATASLRVIVVPAMQDLFAELVTEKDVTAAAQPIRETGDVLFDSLKAGTYMLRLYQDLDGDSVWTTGDCMRQLQPEPVYYFPKRLKIRNNWDFEETFRWQDESGRPK